MPKFAVYAIATASWKIGEYEADTKEAADKLAEDDNSGKWWPGLCHQCANVEINDVYETQVVEADD